MEDFLYESDYYDDVDDLESSFWEMDISSIGPKSTRYGGKNNCYNTHSTVAPSGGKSRSLSTSTPLVSRSLSARNSLDVIPDDSGYADSLAHSSLSSLSDHSAFETPLVSKGVKCSTNLRPVEFEPPLWHYPDEDPVLPKLSETVLDYPHCSLDFEDDDHASDLYDLSLETFALSNKFVDVLQKFSPREPDRLIGRKMGCAFVDIIVELDVRNISSCVSNILSYLDAKDICRMCQVNKCWSQVCANDRKSSDHRQSLKTERFKLQTGKENFGKKRHTRMDRGLTGSYEPFARVQVLGEKKREATKPCIQRDLFKQTASKLRNEEKLRHCPKCHLASKVLPVQERGQCQSPLCNFDFCVKCFSKFHGATPCMSVVAKRTKTDSVGGKKSKRNLKRL